MSELINIVTPIGVLHYVRISGQGKENYNEDGFEFTATVRLQGDEALKVITEIDKVLATIPSGHDIKSKGYKQLVKDEEGKLRGPTLKKPIRDDEELTDLYDFAFKTNTTFADGKGKTIAVYNAKAQKINLGEKAIGNGSLGAISGKMKGGSYKKEFSCSMYLNAIQLTKFIEYEGDAGFDAQDDGFDGVEDEDTGFASQPETEAKEVKEKPKPKL